MLIIHYNPLDLCLIAVYGQGFSLSLDVAFQAGCATAASKILKAVLSKGDKFPVLLAPFALTGEMGSVLSLWRSSSRPEPPAGGTSS